MVVNRSASDAAGWVRSLWDPFPPAEVSPWFSDLLQRSIADLRDLVEQGVTIALTLGHEISGGSHLVKMGLNYSNNLTYICEKDPNKLLNEINALKINYLCIKLIVN
jgi:hypothetical protein